MMGSADGNLKLDIGTAPTLVLSGPGTHVIGRATGAGVSNIGTTDGATLIIEKGAVYEQTVATVLSATAGAKAILNIDGPGSRYTSGGTTSQRGDTTINVTNGGVLQTNSLNMGGTNVVSFAGTSNAILVAGQGSAITASGNLYSTNATWSILDGGKVVGSTVKIGTIKDTETTMLVSGNGSEFASTGTAGIDVGLGGAATVTVANGGRISAQAGTKTIRLSVNATSTGTINVGGSAGEAATKAGTIDADAIQFGAGKGTLNFNHIENDYDFDVALKGTGTVNQVGSGKTTFSADQSAFTGVTNVDAGTLVVSNKLGGSANVNGGRLAVNGILNGPANVVGGILAVNGSVTGDVQMIGGRLQGIGTVGNTINEAGGVIAPGTSIGTLTVNGNYTANGGLLEIETVLGDDRSATDRLVVTGNTTGSTTVRVINLDGGGAPTVEGIRIIEIGGKSDGAFTLKGNYRKDGQDYVIGGAYAYGLYRNGTSVQDGNWYLRSTAMPQEPGNPGNENPGNGNPGGGTDNPGGGNETNPSPRYQAGVPVYEAYAQNLLAANGLPTLQQRVGNRYWNYSASEGNQTSSNSSALWGRIEGAHSRFEPTASASIDNYVTDLWKMQAGLDGQFVENRMGRLIGGLTFQYVNASTDVTSTSVGNGYIDTDGYGFGATLTWYGDDGFYIDSQAHATWYHSDLFSRTIDSGLTSDNHGFGYGLSLETGKRFSATGNWTLTPQAQLIYSSVDFDSFDGRIDTSSTHVALDRGDSLQGRLGLSADHETRWTGTDGKAVRAHAYGIANLYQEFLDGTRINVAGTGLTTANERTWGGIGAGGSYDWADGKYRFYGELAINTSLQNFGDSYKLNGTAGFKVSF
ncbi:MAG: autotransporter family protein [Brucella intermedia]